MNTDTYLSLLFGGIFALSVTVIVAIIQTKRNKQGKRQIRYFKLVIGFLACVAVLLTVIYARSTFERKKSIYNQYIDAGDFCLHTHDYLGAAENYHLANAASYNSDTRLEAVYYEGMCYYLYAFSEEDNQLLQRAAKIYTHIIDTPEYQNSTHYIDALSDMSNLYLFLNYAATDTEWVRIINKLENSDIVEQEIESIASHDELSLKMKVVLTLGKYYDYAAHSTFDNFMNEELSSKVLKYYCEFNELFNLQAKNEGKLTVPDFYSQNIIDIAYYMLNYGLFSDEPAKYFLEAAELCETELERQAANSIEMHTYLQLKTIVGKSNFFLSRVYDSDAYLYLHKTYDVLRPLIEIDMQEGKTDLLNVGYYLARTNLCSEGELDRILDIYDYNIQYSYTAEEISIKSKTILSACSTCKWIVENYDHSSNAITNGLKYSEELNNTLIDFLDDDDKGLAEECYSFFRTAVN